MKLFFLQFSRSLSFKVPSPKTTILLVHNGQPKNLYYAKDFLSKQLIEYNKFPSFLAKFIIDKSINYNKTLSQCMEGYTESVEISNYLDKLSKGVENELTKVASYGSPYKVKYSFNFPISDIDYSIEKSLMNMISKDGTQRFVVLPLHPVYDTKTNEIFKKKIDNFMEKHTEILDNEYTNLKVAKNYPTSFDYSFINEWFNSNFITNYWYNRLEKICTNPEETPDMIIFTIPYVDIPGTKVDRKEFDTIYKDICGDIIKKLGFPSPWRATFYDTWNNLISTNIFDRSNLISSIKEHQKKGKQSIVVVPLFDFIPSFDTVTLLPKIALEKNVKFLEPTNNIEFLSENLTKIIEKEMFN